MQLFSKKNPKKYNAPSAQVLLDAGVIPLCKSNIPQGMFIMESANYVWGTSRNPWKNDRSAGGSSGGEGGLIASHCVSISHNNFQSPLGLGTDIGGSIRIPA